MAGGVFGLGVVHLCFSVQRIDPGLDHDAVLSEGGRRSGPIHTDYAGEDVPKDEPTARAPMSSRPAAGCIPGSDTDVIPSPQHVQRRHPGVDEVDYPAPSSATSSAKARGRERGLTRVCSARGAARMMLGTAPFFGHRPGRW